jgi:hypothetical protein
VKTVQNTKCYKHVQCYIIEIKKLISDGHCVEPEQTPTQPTTLDDIRLHGKWTETVTGDIFLLFDDSEQTNIMTVDISLLM